MLPLLFATAFADESPAPAAEPAPPAASEPAPAPVAAAAPAPAPAAVPIVVTVESPPEHNFQVDISVGGTAFERDPYGTLTSAGITSCGLRASYRLKPWLVPFVGVSTTGDAQSHAITSAWGDATTEFVAGLYQTQVFVGVKPTWSLNRHFGAYGLLQAQGLFGTLRIDDDPDDDENLGQVEAEGFAPGATIGAGVEAFAPTGGAVLVAFYLEFGYSAYEPLSLSDIATIDVSGVAVRAGAGIRF